MINVKKLKRGDVLPMPRRLCADDFSIQIPKPDRVSTRRAKLVSEYAQLQARLAEIRVEAKRLGMVLDR